MKKSNSFLPVSKQSPKTSIQSNKDLKTTSMILKSKDSNMKAPSPNKNRTSISNKNNKKEVIGSNTKNMVQKNDNQSLKTSETFDFLSNTYVEQPIDKLSAILNTMKLRLKDLPEENDDSYQSSSSPTANYQVINRCDSSDTDVTVFKYLDNSKEGIIIPNNNTKPTIELKHIRHINPSSDTNMITDDNDNDSIVSSVSTTSSVSIMQRISWNAANKRKLLQQLSTNDENDDSSPYAYISDSSSIDNHQQPISEKLKEAQDLILSKLSNNISSSSNTATITISDRSLALKESIARGRSRVRSNSRQQQPTRASSTFVSTVHRFGSPTPIVKRTDHSLTRSAELNRSNHSSSSSMSPSRQRTNNSKHDYSPSDSNYSRISPTRPITPTTSRSRPSPKPDLDPITPTNSKNKIIRSNSAPPRSNNLSNSSQYYHLDTNIKSNSNSNNLTIARKDREIGLKHRTPNTLEPPSSTNTFDLRFSKKSNPLKSSSVIENIANNRNRNSLGISNTYNQNINPSSSLRRSSAPLPQTTSRGIIPNNNTKQQFITKDELFNHRKKHISSPSNLLTTSTTTTPTSLSRNIKANKNILSSSSSLDLSKNKLKEDSSINNNNRNKLSITNNKDKNKLNNSRDDHSIEKQLTSTTSNVLTQQQQIITLSDNNLNNDASYDDQENNSRGDHHIINLEKSKFQNNPSTDHMVDIASPAASLVIYKSLLIDHESYNNLILENVVTPSLPLLENEISSSELIIPSSSSPSSSSSINKKDHNKFNSNNDKELFETDNYEVLELTEFGSLKNNKISNETTSKIKSSIKPINNHIFMDKLKRIDHIIENAVLSQNNNATTSSLESYYRSSLSHHPTIQSSLSHTSPNLHKVVFMNENPEFLPLTGTVAARLKVLNDKN